MSDNSKIEWTDATWNPVTGCSVVSPGCANCYAMKLAGGRLAGHPSRAGLTADSKAGPVWTGEVRFNAGWLDQPLRWKRPRRIFVCAHGDLFHESVPDEWIDRVFAVMALAPWHTFQVLTKRSARMRAYFVKKVREDPPGRFRPNNNRRSAIYGRLAGWGSLPRSAGGFGLKADVVAARMHALSLGGWPLSNVWLGVSVEDQARADARIPDLLETPAAIRFVSAEPLLGDIELDCLWPKPPAGGTKKIDALTGEGFQEVDLGPLRRSYQGPRLDWVIVGGESGPGSRAMHPDWARSLRDQCAAAGVAFHFKQWGDWLPVDCWTAGPRTRAEIAILLNGDRVPDDVVPQEVGGHRMRQVGKAAAGRLLDGRTHDGLPEAAAI